MYFGDLEVDEVAGVQLLDYREIDDNRELFDDSPSMHWGITGSMGTRFEKLVPNDSNYEVSDQFIKWAEENGIEVLDDPESCCCYFYFSSRDDAERFVDAVNSKLRERARKLKEVFED